MRFRILMATLLLSGGIPLLGQIEGQVMLYQDGQRVPAPNAEVYWEGTKVGTTTDAEGFYRIEKPAGARNLIANFTGFKPESKIIISRKGKTDFVLFPESTELDGVTVTGEAEATRIKAEAAGLHYEIGTKELRKAACCNLAESFETNASIDVSFSDAVTGTKQIEMLGLAGKYALIQRENIPFARGLNTFKGLAFVPGPFIESIQVTKGLSSVINGFESITGQINVEYYKPETAPKLLVNAFGNAGGRTELNALIRSDWDNDANFQNATMAHFSTIPIAQDRNNDGFADITNGRQFNILNRSHYRIGENWEGQFGLNFVDDFHKGGQLSYLNEDAASAWGFESSERRYEVFGKNGYVFPEEQLRSLGIIYNASYQERSSVYGLRTADFDQASFYLNTIFHDFIGSLEHQFKTGLSFQFDEVNERLSSNTFGTLELYRHQRQEAVPGAYFEYNYIPNDDFSLVAGVRGDYNSWFDRFYVSPRLQVRYQVHRNTTLRLSGGRGQRSPNRLAENSSALASSRTIRFVDPYRVPEIAWNSGFSWSQNIILGEQLIRWNTDLFYTWFESKLIMDLDYDPREAYIYNRSGSNSFSLLSQLDFSPIENLDFRLAYKYLKSQENFLEGLDYAYLIPEHRAFLNTSYDLKEAWKFDLTLNWFGRKRLPNTKLSPDEFQQVDWSPSFFTVNSQINYSWKNLELFAGVDNLFNFQQENPIVSADSPFGPYFDSNFVWGPIFGRNIYLGLYYRDRKSVV